MTSLIAVGYVQERQNGPLPDLFQNQLLSVKVGFLHLDDFSSVWIGFLAFPAPVQGPDGESEHKAGHWDHDNVKVNHFLN